METEAIRIPVPTVQIAEFCRRRHIRKLAFFGSVLRADFGPVSDVDVLVDFEPSARIGFFELYDMEQELSQILGTRRVDLNTSNSLSKYFREQVLTDVRIAYVQT